LVFFVFFSFFWTQVWASEALPGGCVVVPSSSAFWRNSGKLLKIEVQGTERVRFVTRDVGGGCEDFSWGFSWTDLEPHFGALVITLGGSYRAPVMLWNLEFNQGNGCCKDFGVGWTVDFASSFGIRLSFKEDLSPAAMRWPFLSWILSSFVA
jgi:hypothetical protein